MVHGVLCTYKGQWLWSAAIRRTGRVTTQPVSPGGLSFATTVCRRAWMIRIATDVYFLRHRLAIQ